jgi:hypothetical protein
VPTTVTIGQKWSVWSPSRRQWLLATVIGQEDGRATLEFDARYEISATYDKHTADGADMLAESSLFRFIEG